MPPIARSRLTTTANQTELQMSLMNTHAPVVLARASEAPRRDDRPANEGPTVGEGLQEVLSLISAPAFFGPPVIFLLGPWLLLVLLLIGPAALLITLLLVAAIAAGLLVALSALIASPYLLVRHLRARHQIARPAAAVSEGSGPRAEPPVIRPVRPRLIHLTTR